MYLEITYVSFDVGGTKLEKKQDYTVKSPYKEHI